MLKVMIAGLPGNMAKLVAEEVIRAKDMELTTVALSRSGGDKESTLVGGKIHIAHILPDLHEGKIEAWGPDIIVDFTSPDSVQRNAEIYCNLNVPFVMGTTGGDRALLAKTVEGSAISAVIATNMAKQIVVFMDMIGSAAKKFPGSFKGYRLVISESHQQAKKDVSGTAKALIQHFNEMGIPFSADQIVMERDPIRQEVSLGVPPLYLGGHGYHTYKMLSPDGTAFFQFTHNVNGRSIYVEGAMTAIRFLAGHLGDKGKVFTMMDVLQG